MKSETNLLPNQMAENIRRLFELQQSLSEEYPFMHFKLCASRTVGWLVEVCEDSRERIQDRKMLAQGHGNTLDEACAAALEDHARRRTI